MRISSGTRSATAQRSRCSSTVTTAHCIASCAREPVSRSPTLIFLDPALELARRNVGEAGLSERIELRRQDIREITDAAAFDLVWLPGPFLQRDVLEVSLARVTTALRPGGWVVLGLYGGQDELGAALARLRTVRSGGTALGNDEAVALLESAGLVGVEALTANVGVPVTDVVGRRPGAEPRRARPCWRARSRRRGAIPRSQAGSSANALR